MRLCARARSKKVRLLPIAWAVSWADSPSSSPARYSALRSIRFPLTPLAAALVSS